MDFSDSLLDFHSKHFSDDSKKTFLKSLYQQSHPSSPSQQDQSDGHSQREKPLQKDQNVSLHLSKEIIEMFRFSEEFKKSQREEQQDSPVEETIVEPIKNYGEKNVEIIELEKELEEKGKQFIDFHVWPVLPLKF